MVITTHAYARAGIVGNPSDGYYGKTISCIIRNFSATVRLWESPRLEIVPASDDLCQFGSVEDFLRDVRLHGYYGGMRLIKASIYRFHAYCREQGVRLHSGTFTIEFESDVPRLDRKSVV
jgi:glucuronokinase